MREVSKEGLPDIYCDLDQVLVNFMKGAEEAKIKKSYCKINLTFFDKSI